MVLRPPRSTRTDHSFPTRRSSDLTVERKQGRWQLEDGRHIDLIDLPGTYSLDARSPDEQVTHDVVMGRQAGERRPDAIVAVVDATNLDNHLRFVLQLKKQIGRAHV